MTDLIQLLQDKAGISPEQAQKAIHAIKEFVTEKFPMLSGAVDNLFADTGNANSTQDAPKADGGNIMDKISDIIPGEAGEKVEDMVKGLFGGEGK